MGESEARFHVSLGSGTFEVSGSQEFVEGQIEKHSETLLDMINKLRHSSAGVKNSSGNSELSTGTRTTDKGGNNGSDVSNPFGNVLAFDDGKVTIITSIPGKNSKEKTINAALLYLLGKDALGENKASFKEIRQVCEDHGFLDSANFAKSLKSEKSRFIFSGGPRSQGAKLTVPGTKEAKELAEKLQNT